MTTRKSYIPYSVKIIVNVFTMTFITAYLTFFLLENFAAQDSIFVVKEPRSDIYIVDSAHTRKTMSDWGLDGSQYQKQLDAYSARFNHSPYKVKRINANEIKTISSDSVLLVLDAITLSTNNIKDIEAYVQRGGSLMMNHMAGFNDPAGDFRGGSFVKAMTGLSYQKLVSEQLPHEGLFITPKILSPLTKDIPDGDRLSLVVYETLPVFQNNYLKPDVVLTNWAQNKPPSNFRNESMPVDNSGVMWHGLKGEGRWVFFSFPGYVFNEKGSQAEQFDQLLQGAINYLRLPTQLRIMPYLDSDSATIVFEDVEYKYETLNEFIGLAEKYSVPLTTFQVADVAKTKPALLARSHQSPFIEVASHSYTHGPIIGQPNTTLSKELEGSKAFLQKGGEEVLGFRPPREELDDEMLEVLIDADYGYVLASAQDKMYPQILANQLVVLPRLGTDDYEFFVTGKMTGDKIQSTVFKEESFIRGLNGVYTLGVHTHLMTYGKNLKILDNILEYLTQDKNINIMSAQQLTHKVRTTQNIEHSVSTTNQNHLINVTNNNRTDVEHFTLRLYWHGSKPITSIKSDKIGAKISYKHFLSDKYSDIHIRDMKANSNMSIFAKYEN